MLRDRCKRQQLDLYGWLGKKSFLTFYVFATPLTPFAVIALFGAADLWSNAIRCYDLLDFWMPAAKGSFIHTLCVFDACGCVRVLVQQKGAVQNIENVLSLQQRNRLPHLRPNL